MALAPAQTRLIIAAAIALAAAVGLSRVYLGVHWPTDVMGGWTLGVGWLALAGTALSAAGLTRAQYTVREPRQTELMP